jgi:hypothetical protein
MRGSHLLEEVGLHRGGGNAVDQNAATGQLLAQGFGEANDPGLGGAVGRGLGITFNWLRVFRSAGPCTSSLRLIPTVCKPGKMLSFLHLYEGVLPWSPLSFSIS